MNLFTTDTPKMLRETLCVAQGMIGRSNDPRREEHTTRLQRLIDSCDYHRPLGPDGKHGNLHTATCGCQDKVAPEIGRPEDFAIHWTTRPEEASLRVAMPEEGYCFISARAAVNVGAVKIMIDGDVKCIMTTANQCWTILRPWFMHRADPGTEFSITMSIEGEWTDSVELIASSIPPARF